MVRPGVGPTGSGAGGSAENDRLGAAVSDGEPFVRLLGPVQFITAGGGCIDLPSVTQRQVLAALALEPRATMRPEALCDRLGLSAGALRTTVSRVRGRVGAGVIVTDALGYRITCRTDAEMFESLLFDRLDHPDRVAALRAALDLWRGPALDEFRHERWSEAQVFRLDELHDLAVEDLAEAQIDSGHGGEAVAALQAHLAHRPRGDRARGLHIRALASVGRQADALRAYQEYRSLLVEETGTEPSPEVRAIERQVVGGWDGRASSARPGLDAGGDDTEHRMAGSLPSALTGDGSNEPVGRGAELGALRSEFDAVLEGRGARGVLVVGEAGIGKTTLVAAFARAVDSAGEATILYGRCPDGVDDPLQPFRSVVGALVAETPTDVLVAHARRCGGDLQRIAPAIAQRTWVPAPTRADEATERHQLFEAVADLLARAAEAHPLVIVLDDLHDAQPTALRLMRHLVAELGGTRILLLATLRDLASGPTDDLRTMVADLDRLGIRRLEIPGFDDHEIGRLVGSIIGATAPVTPELTDALRQQTAGNPLYAAQLVRHLDDAGGIVADGRSVRLSRPLDDSRVPASLADVVWARVRALGGAAPRVLRCAAVLGTSFDPQLLAEICDASEGDVDAALTAGQRAGLLREEQQGGEVRLRFVHGLVARALLDELSPAERRRAHRRAADALEATGPDLPLRVVAQLAHHRAQSGDRRAAQRWAVLAGDRSRAQLASADAVRWYSVALEHARALDRPDAEIAGLLVELASAQHHSGRLGLAAASVREAADLARRAGAHAVLVDAALAGDRGHVRATTVDFDRLELVEAALAVVDADDLNRRARLLAQHAQELVHTDRDGDRERSALLAIELSERSEDPTLLAQLISPISFGLWGISPLDVRADVARRGAQSARGSPDPLVQFGSSRASYHVAIESGDAELAVASRSRMRAISGRLRDPQLTWSVATYDVFEATMAARLERAEELLEQNLALGVEINEPDALAIYGGQLFVIRSFAFRYAELLPLLDELVSANPGVSAFALAHAIACATTGRRAEARRFLEASLDAGLPSTRDHYWLTTLVGYAVLALELGDVCVAERLYPVLAPYSAHATFNGATSQGPVVAYLGKLASLLGRHDVADAHLREALAFAERCGWRYHRATTLVAMASSRHRRLGTLGDEERGWLDEATAIAAESGLAGVHHQAAALVESVS